MGHFHKVSPSPLAQSPTPLAQNTPRWIKALGLSALTLSMALVSACAQPYAAFQPSAAAARVQQQSASALSPGTPYNGGSLSGNFRLHSQVSSRYLSNARDVLVWLPPDYDSNSSQRYPVLYVHDGNNLFDRRTTFGGVEWQLDETAGRLIQSQAITPVIVVGVYNSPARMEEYTWYPDTLDGKTMGGKGQQYADFLVKELKPLIDQSYRTQSDKKHTGIMGSSLGGLISFYTARAYPNTFGQVGMISPSVWWKDEQAKSDIGSFPKDVKIWVDMGTREGSNPDAMLQTAKDFVSGLENAGFAHFKNLAFHIEEGGDHSEAAWARRLDRPLRFFYTP